MLAAETLDQVRRMHIRTRRLVDGAFAGEYHSIFKGRGMEFAEVREYLPGDDVRSIDWNVTARVGRPFVKQYVEERELTVMLAIDCSASTSFTSVERRKTSIAGDVAAILAMSAIRNNDKVGLILFTDEVEKFIPPQKGRSRALYLIHELLSFKPRRLGTDVGKAIEFLLRTTHRRSVSFIISDFRAPDYERPLRLAHKRHDLIPISIDDPREIELPEVGLLTVRDLETGKRLVVDTASAAVRERYRDHWKTTVAQRRGLFYALGLDIVELSTDQPFFPPLLGFFHRRQRRLSQGR